jgi:SAM-dependent methyltransferase
LAPEVALNLSRGCGNPTGFANLKPGDVVVDFGCGGGIDVILAARRVGKEGRVVGVDFSPQMIERAKKAVIDSGLQQWDIELRIADMGESQLPGECADVVISNCVINLCPDKSTIYEEAFRILKHGGRLAISDIVLIENIDSQLHKRFQSTWAGCLGGAILEESYWQIMGRAGFTEIQIVSRHTLTPMELKAMACCPGEAFTPLPNNEDLEIVQGKVDSVKFTAIKPPSA